MAQQSATVQTTTTGTDIAPVLGTLQSVGPNTQAPAVLSNIQSNSTTTTTIQTQSQQTQYISQPAPKQVQQSSTPNFSDFPQVCDLLTHY